MTPFETSFLKTLWKKEKLDNFLQFSLNLKLSSTNSFNLQENKICRLLIG